MLLLLSFVAVALGAAKPNQRLALLSFCSTTNIASVLDNWCTAGSDVCTWQGVACDPAKGVTDLDLRGADITGTWPAAFDAQMTGLDSMRVQTVGITGTISAELFENCNATLTAFTMIDTTQLGVDIANILSQRIVLGKLKNFILSTTDTHGEISNPAGRLVAPELGVFVVDRSRLSGELVDAVFTGALENMEFFSMKSNALTGSVGSFLCNASLLAFLDLSSNRFVAFHPCLKQASVTFAKCNLERNFLCGSAPDLGECVVDATPNAIIDACGICGGNSLSCIDCSGTANGTLTLDVCGVCGGLNNTCSDCQGVPAGTSRYDVCDVCNGPSSCADCNGVPNGSSVYDLCDVCDGDSLSCVDCRGNLFGTSVYDICNVCNGNGTTCTDCRGIPAGTSRYDACDVCDGSNQCIDCAGVAGGDLKYDACGVCGGDGEGCGVSDILNDASDARETGAVRVVILVLVGLLACCTILGCCFFALRSRARN